MEPFSYTWIFVVAVIWSCFDAYGIGANDVANSFATSVGSKALKLWQACLIAAFTEFFGAFLLGKSVTETVRKGIIKSEPYEANPELLMLTMWCSLIGSSFWVITASRLGLPVSTTHATVGAIIGGGIAAFGVDVVDWSVESGVLKIVLSWVASPLLAGSFGAVLFLTTKYGVLVRKNSFYWALYSMPFFFLFTFAIILFFFVYKGSPQLGLKNLEAEYIAGIVLSGSILAFVLAWVCFVPWASRNILNGEDLKFYHMPFALLWPYTPKKDEVKVKEEEEEEEEKGPSCFEKASNLRFIGKFLKFFGGGVQKEVADYDHDNPKMQKMHNAARKFDQQTEDLFSFLQVATAAFASFAHGANDVANAIGPLSAIYAVWQTGVVDASSPVEPWILVLGGVFIDIGLMTYGYKIMRALGNQITYHSPSRGFCMETAAMITVLVASFTGIPVSTTHCITGATVGVGLCNGRDSIRALNWKLLLYVMFSWIITLPAAGVVAGLCFAAMAYSPGIPGYNG